MTKKQWLGTLCSVIPVFETGWPPPAGCQPAGPAQTACCPSPGPKHNQFAFQRLYGTVRDFRTLFFHELTALVSLQNYFRISGHFCEFRAIFADFLICFAITYFVPTYGNREVLNFRYHIPESVYSCQKWRRKKGKQGKHNLIHKFDHRWSVPTQHVNFKNNILGSSKDHFLTFGMHTTPRKVNRNSRISPRNHSPIRKYFGVLNLEPLIYWNNPSSKISCYSPFQGTMEPFLALCWSRSRTATTTK